jgi:hypothetical protein
MGTMAARYRRLLSNLWPLIATLVFGAYLFGSGLFRFWEGFLVFGCCLIAWQCARPHFGTRRPEHMLMVMASLIFLIAYIAQAMLFIKVSRTPAATLGEALSVRSVFSAMALEAGPVHVLLSLEIILMGFIGILLPSAYVAYGGLRGRAAIQRPCADEAAPRVIISNPLTLGYAALICTLFFGFFRKYFGLESPTATGLPMGIGGVINIASAYIGPNLSFAAFFFALHQGNDSKARRLALIMMLLGLYNYILFTSKLSLIFPVLFLLICQYLLNRKVVSARTVLLLGGLFVVVYPFLNLYRSAIALGIAPSDLIDAIAKMYQSQQDASDLDHNVVQVAISAILGRLVGYDPLMILLQANPYPDSLVGYLLYGNLDTYLTYDILNFQDPMGYSPGFLGRFYYVSLSFVYVLTMTAGTVAVLSGIIRRCWLGDLRLQFVAPLLLTYSLIFFTDGIRFELLRSLVISIIVIYGFLRVASTLRPTRAN